MNGMSHLKSTYSLCQCIYKECWFSLKKNSVIASFLINSVRLCLIGGSTWGDKVKLKLYKNEEYQRDKWRRLLRTVLAGYFLCRYWDYGGYSSDVPCI